MFEHIFVFYGGPTIELSKDEYRDITDMETEKKDQLLIPVGDNIQES